MSILRPLLLLAIAIFTCWLSHEYSAHHEISNANPLVGLYGHVLPVPLVSHGDVDEAGAGGASPESSGHGAAEHESEAEAHEGGHADVAAEAEGHEAGGHEAGGHAPQHPLLALPVPAGLAAIDWDHDPSNGTHIVVTNLQLFQLAALIMIFIAFSGVPGYLRSGRGDAITRVLTGFCLYIRDEMAVPTMGKETTDRFLPLFLSLFFFIMFMNVMGLMPGAATPTASIFVTAALALITFGSMIGCGMAAQGGLAFWKNLVPHVPGWLWPLMFVVELIGLIVKPCALTIRLFANMTGGHMVVLSFLGLIFLFAGEEMSAAGGYGAALPAIGFAVFIMIIEAFVALLQAYIFTQLSILFVGASIHPEH